MTTDYRQFPGALLACGLLAGAAHSANSVPLKPVVSLGDLEKLITLSKPALSPDGRLAAVVVSRPDFARDRRSSSLVLVNTRTGAQRIVATDNPAEPAFSPQRNQLAWLASGADGTRQIAMLPLDSAQATPLTVTHAPKNGGVRKFIWNPDGTSFAYIAPEAAQASAGDAPIDRTFEPPDSDYLGISYLATSGGEAPGRLWLISAKGGQARMLASQNGSIKGLAWLPSGGALVVSTQPGSSDVSARLGALSSIEVEGGREAPLIPAPVPISPGVDPRVSSLGQIAYQHFRGDDPWTFPSRVAVVENAQSREVTTALDRAILDFYWMPGGKDLLVTAPDHMRNGAWLVGQAGDARRINLGQLSVDSIAPGASSGTLAFVGSEPQVPSELYVMSSATSKPVRLTRFNAFVDDERVGSVRTIEWKNDGFDHEGILTYPPDFHAGEKYPLLVSIHGGPEWSARLSFNPESQYFAARGWLVFEPNYRGNYDQGERYQTAVIGDATAGPGRDISAGIEAVTQAEKVDEARIALTGYSYGGVMTSWLIGHHQNWCAAIPGGVVVDFTQYYDQSETGIWMKTVLGSPHLRDNRRKYLEQSPATYLDQARTPTLVLQNVGDPNATVGQAYSLYHALKDNGVKARLILWNLEGHDPDSPIRQKQMLAATLNWMNENCVSH